MKFCFSCSISVVQLCQEILFTWIPSGSDFVIMEKMSHYFTISRDILERRLEFQLSNEMTKRYGKLVLDKHSWRMDNSHVPCTWKRVRQIDLWNIEMYYILMFHWRNVIRNPSFFAVFANIFLLFIYRVKYFRGKKLNGEYEIRVEQVCAIKSSSSFWVNYCSYIASHFSFYLLNFFAKI